MALYKRIVTAYGVYGEALRELRMDRESLKMFLESEIAKHYAANAPTISTRVRRIPQNHIVSTCVTHYVGAVDWLDEVIGDHSIILIGHTYATVSLCGVETVQPTVVFGDTVESIKIALERIDDILVITDILYAVGDEGFDGTNESKLIAEYLSWQFNAYIPFGKRGSMDTEKDAAVTGAIVDLNASGGNIQSKYHCTVLSDISIIRSFFTGNDTLCSFLENTKIFDNVDGGMVIPFSSLLDSGVAVTVAHNARTYTNELGDAYDARGVIAGIMAHSPEYIIVSIGACPDYFECYKDGMLALHINVFDDAKKVEKWKEDITDEDTGELECLVWCVWERVSCVDIVQFPEKAIW